MSHENRDAPLTSRTDLLGSRPLSGPKICEVMPRPDFPSPPSSRRARRRPGAPMWRDHSEHQDVRSEADREAFLGILSHELRTPVTTIYGGAKLLATHELSPEHRRAVAADVSVEAERLYRLVEDLVMLARSERDGIHPVDEPVAVGRLAIAAIEREILARPELEIRFLGSRDAATDAADEGLVAHVLRNLLDNAIRHGGLAGPIEVIIDASADEVVVRIIHRGDAPVADGDAFGLSRRPTTAAGRSGAGIALYVARRLVEAMRGRIWAVSVSSASAEFGFALRRSRPGLAVRPA